MKTAAFALGDGINLTKQTRSDPTAWLGFSLAKASDPEDPDSYESDYDMVISGGVATFAGTLLYETEDIFGDVTFPPPHPPQY